MTHLKKVAKHIYIITVNIVSKYFTMINRVKQLLV